MSTLCYEDIVTAYPQFRECPLRDGWNEEDSDTLSQFISGVSSGDMQNHLDTGSQVIQLGETAFKAWVSRPDDWDGSTIIIPGEFANGLSDPKLTTRQDSFVILRALALRHLVNEHALVTVLPNDNLYERHNLGFTRKERESLRCGKPLALVDRMRKLLDVSGGADNPDVVGLSQGAAVASAFALHSDTDVGSLTVVEAPNVLDRTTDDLMADFFGCAKRFPDNQQLGGVEPSVGWRGAIGFMQYAAGIVSRNNLSITPILAQDTLEKAIRSALSRKAGVMHMWAEGDKVSPAEVNSKIARRLTGNDGYSATEISGQFADHSVTANLQIVTAGVRLARANKASL